MRPFKSSLLLGNIVLAVVVLGFHGPVDAVKHVKGQTVYIPSYSNMISGINRITLKANLIVHNIDPLHPITVLRIDHYDTNGGLVEHYLPQPLSLKPLAAARIVIKEPKPGDEGAGANFVVQWRADTKVIEPLMECFMVGSVGTQGYSFSSVGRIMQEESD
jgi:hypothetical protein